MGQRRSRQIRFFQIGLTATKNTNRVKEIKSIEDTVREGERGMKGFEEVTFVLRPE